MYPECRHILTSGKKCHSPALNGKAYCYFHLRYRRQKPRQPLTSQDHLVAAGYSIQSVDIPVLEDRGAVQMAISEVLHALACGQIEPRRAGLLLYGLQIASQNAQRDQAIAARSSIRTLTHSEEGEELAPAENGFDLEDIDISDQDEDDEEYDNQDRDNEDQDEDNEN